MPELSDDSMDSVSRKKMGIRSASLVSFSKAGGAGNVLRSLAEGLRTRGVQVHHSTKIEQSLREEPLKSPHDTIAAAVDNYLIKQASWTSPFSLLRNSLEKTDIVDSSADLHILRWPIGIVGLRENIFGNKPVIWGLPDMHSFTGGCHYSGNCIGFKTGCRSCPAVKSLGTKRVEKELNKKFDFYSRVPNLLFLSPTRWMLEQAEASGLASVSDIRYLPNPVPSIYFKELRARDFSRERKLRVGFVAAKVSDPLKGYDTIKSQIAALVEEHKIEFYVVGDASAKLAEKNSSTVFLGRKSREEMVDFYDEVDIIVVPSKEENVGGVVPEAQARGVPALVSDVGGLPEQVEKGGGWTISNMSEIGQFIEGLDRSEIAKQSQLGLERTALLSPEAIAGSILEIAQRMSNPWN